MIMLYKNEIYQIKTDYIYLMQSKVIGHQICSSFFYNKNSNKKPKKVYNYGKRMYLWGIQ